MNTTSCQQSRSVTGERVRTDFLKPIFGTVRSELAETKVDVVMEVEENETDRTRYRQTADIMQW